MTNEKVDRRVRRTRELLLNALVSLILEKGYERLTVQDIIDRADIGRSTFYAHFRDKEDLLLSGFEEIRVAFEARESQTGDGAAAQEGTPPTLAVFEHAAAYRQVYKAMLGKRGAEVVRRHLHRLLSELLREHLGTAAQAREARVPLDVVVEFAVGSLEGLLHWWLDSDSPYSPEEMNELYRGLAEPGIRSALRASTGPRGR